MSDTKKPEAVELVVLRTGFYGGALRHPDTKFMFTGSVIPKWAALATDTPVDPAAKVIDGDTKPKAAQAAARKKASAFTGG